MNKTEADQRRKLNETLLGLSVGKKRSMIRNLFPGARQHLCGDFLALDSPKEDKWPSNALARF
jgi:hypothetical protein